MLLYLLPFSTVLYLCHLLIMVKHYSKLGGTQQQNTSISGSQQEKGWEPMGYEVVFTTIRNSGVSASANIS